MSTDHWVLTVQRKNWDPLVLGPALAMERIPGPVCFNVKFSSANLGGKQKKKKKNETKNMVINWLLVT